MESHNPILSRSAEFRRGGYVGFDRQGVAAGAASRGDWSPESAYARPPATPADTGRMTYDDVLVRTGLTLGAVVLAAGIGWYVPGLMLVGLLGGLVLGIVNSVKREPSRVLILAYAALEGLFLGGLSGVLDARFNGIAVQALIATAATTAVILVLYRSRVLRATPRFRKTMLVAVLGYAAFCLVNLVLSLVGIDLGLWSGGLGLLVGAVGTVLAALCLVLDFDMVEQGVRNGIPQRYAWTAAFGLTVTLVWLYIEFLRILSVLRSMAGD